MSDKTIFNTTLLKGKHAEFHHNLSYSNYYKLFEGPHIEILYGKNKKEWSSNQKAIADKPRNQSKHMQQTYFCK